MSNGGVCALHTETKDYIERKPTMCSTADLMGFIGALGTGPTTFWYPSVIWLAIKKPRFGSMHFIACWICIVLGVIVTVLGSIGGLRGIIVDAKDYKIYQ